jgi:hypothetical protein
MQQLEYHQLLLPLRLLLLLLVLLLSRMATHTRCSAAPA